jgi:hypothetical protein
MLNALGSISVRDVAGLRLVNIFGICFFDTPYIYSWEAIRRNKIIIIIIIMNVFRV